MNITIPSYHLSSIWSLLLIIAVFWSITWKGIALWKASKNNALGWFILMLIINTVGVLEIVYIFIISKKSDTKS